MGAQVGAQDDAIVLQKEGRGAGEVHEEEAAARRIAV